MPAGRSLLTWVLPGLKARWIRNADSGRGRGFVSARSRANDFTSYWNATRSGALLPALGVRLRTVGDFFCGPSVHREGGAWVPSKTFIGDGGCCALIG